MDSGEERVRQALAHLGSDAASAPDVPAGLTARIGAALRAAPQPAAHTTTAGRPRLSRLRRHRSHPTTELKDDNCPIGDPTSRVDTAIVVERALMRLPVEQRAAVVAVDMHGYSVAETARMLGIAEGTVKSRCSRARAKLAEVLGYFDSRAVPDARGAMQ